MRADARPGLASVLRWPKRCQEEAASTSADARETHLAPEAEARRSEGKWRNVGDHARVDPRVLGKPDQPARPIKMKGEGTDVHRKFNINVGF
ncbi:hypothetical protein NL676_002151 [Syzygium grande]|nr:hypothetical protein NL676_002151 [Syzygium grande]